MVRFFRRVDSYDVLDSRLEIVLFVFQSTILVYGDLFVVHFGVCKIYTSKHSFIGLTPCKPLSLTESSVGNLLVCSNLLSPATTLDGL
jgi:hypothetical protein